MNVTSIFTYSRNNNKRYNDFRIQAIMFNFALLLTDEKILLAVCNQKFPVLPSSD